MKRAIFTLVLAPFAFANTPPSAPVIQEPAIELQALNGADVHMVTSEIADADGDQLRCSDWEIREENEDVVWSAPCVEGSLALHIHLGDGIFSGTHAGAKELRPAARFELRVRHRDDSGDPETEWSAWSSRRFQTVVPTPVSPMSLRDVLSDPGPRWFLDGGDADGDPVVIPPGATLALETVDGEPLVDLGTSEIVHAEPRLAPVIVRLRIASGDAPWLIAKSELSFDDARGRLRTVYLPEISLLPKSEAFYWVSANGSTHRGASADRTPDFTKIARGAPVPWTLERGFRAEVFAKGFELPVSVVAVPNPGSAPDSPLLYVAELYGTVKVVTRSGAVHEFARGLLNFDPRAPIPGNGERGLGGITIDPANGDLVVTGVYQIDPESAWVSPRVLRLQSADGGLTAARVVKIVEFPFDIEGASHQISNVTFGPDGKLYVHVGSSFADASQLLHTTDGKILRMNGDGAPSAGNPFYNPDDGITATDYIFSLGFRNPFGGAWRAADQSLYEVENGPATDRLAKVVNGRNYLWDGTDESMRNHAIYNWSSPVAPIQIAFTEPERFNGSGFPASKLRSAFVTESGATWASGPQQFGKKISEFVIGFDETLISGPTTFAVYNGSGKATAAGLVAGPDGLYFTDLYKDYDYIDPFDAGANLFRIQWVGFADFRARFDGSFAVALDDRSEVPDASVVSWDFGDGTMSSERNPVHRYQESGTYLVRQTVTGPRGTVTQAQRVFVGNDAGEVLAEYYASEEDESPVAIESQRLLQFDWSHGLPAPSLADGFVARFSTGVTPRFSETYTFTVSSNDRVRLMIDGKPVIDAWEPDGSATHTASVALIAGHTHEVAVHYAPGSDAPSLRVTWESASQPTQIVPRSLTSARRRAASPF